MTIKMKIATTLKTIITMIKPTKIKIKYYRKRTQILIFMSVISYDNLNSYYHDNKIENNNKNNNNKIKMNVPRF